MRKIWVLFASLLLTMAEAQAGAQAPKASLSSSLSTSTSLDIDTNRPAATSLPSLPAEAQKSILAQLAKLTASDGASFDFFGYFVAVHLPAGSGEHRQEDER